MSTEANRRQMKQRHFNRKPTVNICGDAWLDLLEFFDIAKVGTEMALLNHRLDEIVDMHFKTTPRTCTFGVLEIQRLSTRTAGGRRGARIVNYVDGVPKQLPLLQHHLPAIVVGFEHITISYVDRSVIAFLRRIGRLFDFDHQKSKIILQMNILRTQNRALQVFEQHICPLLLGLSLPAPSQNMSSQLPNDDDGSFTSFAALENDGPSTSSAVQQQPTTTSNAANDYHEPSSTIAPLSADQMVAKWLHCTPCSADGRPKIVEYRQLRKPALLKNMVDELKKIFLADSMPTNYIVIMHLHFSILPFELRNEQTHELLTSIHFLDDDDTFLVERGPIVRDEHQWTEWEMEAIRGNWNGVVQVSIGDDDIGPLPSPPFAAIGGLTQQNGNN